MRHVILTNYGAIYAYSRILSVLVTCLDSALFLESEYKFIDTLFSLQKDGQTGKAKEG